MMILFFKEGNTIMKYFVLIPDGMADESIEALGGLTPMQKANKPCMDSLARNAVVGTVSNVPEGMVPESDTANLAILSYDPKTCRLTGRIVNVCADESVLGENGKVDVAKLQPITYDPMNHHYLVLGEKVGQAFHDGVTLK